MAVISGQIERVGSRPGSELARLSLYDPRFDRDSCGVGFAARTSGQPDHSLVRVLVHAVNQLNDRGAKNADGTGDGAGILTQIPRKLIIRETGLPEHSIDPSSLALGMMFLPQESSVAELCLARTQEALTRNGLQVLGVRDVPTNPDVLAPRARATQPKIVQMIIGQGQKLSEIEYARKLYEARRDVEIWADKKGIDGFYIPSFSNTTVVYKGLMMADQLDPFYPDLSNSLYETALGIFHSRFATNTTPNWDRAQPMRGVAHNGEINTTLGNRRWVHALQTELGYHSILLPDTSDSGEFDNALEWLTLQNPDILANILKMMPPAWEHNPEIDARIRALLEVNAAQVPPYEGPANIAFTDGHIIGASMDRNGFRPNRYVITEDELVVSASEIGVLDVPNSQVIEKGRLGGGQTLAVDIRNHLVLKDDEIKGRLAEEAAMEETARKIFISVPRIDAQEGNDNRNGHEDLSSTAEELLRLQSVFGYGGEDLRHVVTALTQGKGAVWSMGDDAPLAVLSPQPRKPADYAREEFAEVTNPPIDSPREKAFMTLETYIGPKLDPIGEVSLDQRLIRTSSPILNERQMAVIEKGETLRATTLDTLFEAKSGPDALKLAIEDLCIRAEAAAKSGVEVLVLSDRSVDKESAPIPMIMAVGAVNDHLINKGLRLKTDLVVKTGDAWDVHHFAVLIGYGATAVHPYLALDSAEQIGRQTFAADLRRRKTNSQDVSATEADLPLHLAKAGKTARENLVEALDTELLKVLARGGFPNISSYQGSQAFEMLGIGQDVIDLCFKGTVSRIGGISIRQIAQDVLTFHSQAFADGLKRLPDYGRVGFKRDGEYHSYNPTIVRTLRAACVTGVYEQFREFVRLSQERAPTTISDLLEYNPQCEAIPLDEVESMEEIRRRFISTAMSLGALSPIAHRTLAVAMNKIGARSNSGEGGEDPRLYVPDEDGNRQDNMIKQVASGRFGVTPEYLAKAKELEIKMAQGSKPGEGGQIPSDKVTEFIATLRNAVQGTSLVSPPPHHDIYSIEDIQQLRRDLNEANPWARIGVKLVSKAGVGNIAAGVVKGGAKYVLISGHSGGTGASPLSSIKFVGAPWELGVAETHQALVENGLRAQATIRTDGGLKTGRDVVKAAMLGAQEFGFGTAALVAIGCEMARQCHLNTCPTGVATQMQKKIDLFEGDVEHVINYFTHLAENTREELASLGLRSLDEATARPDLLRQKVFDPDADGPESKWTTLDLRRVLAPTDDSWKRIVVAEKDRSIPRGLLNAQLLTGAIGFIENGNAVVIEAPINNYDSSVGTRLSYEITTRYGSEGMAPDTITLRLKGHAGQSLGAFMNTGIKIILEGEANDYVGKGLGGGTIVVRHPEDAAYDVANTVSIGNGALYGATNGALFASGAAGDRFGVRNSGARAVVRSVGDHAFEYQTKGVGVVLENTGRNLGAGMSGGRVYVWDPEGKMQNRIHRPSVRVTPLHSREDLTELFSLIDEYVEATEDPLALSMRDNWDSTRLGFVIIEPNSVLSPQQTGNGHLSMHQQSLPESPLVANI